MALAVRSADMRREQSQEFLSLAKHIAHFVADGNHLYKQKLLQHEGGVR